MDIEIEPHEQEIINLATLMRAACDNFVVDQHLSRDARFDWELKNADSDAASHEDDDDKWIEVGWRKLARAALLYSMHRKLPPVEAKADGAGEWKLVPVEMTERMRFVFFEGTKQTEQQRWEQVLTAAPSPSTGTVSEVEIEAAARSLAGHTDSFWRDLSIGSQRPFLRQAFDALTAAASIRAKTKGEQA